MLLPNTVVKHVQKVVLLLTLNKHVLIVQLGNTKNTPLRNLTVATRVQLEKNSIPYQPRALIAVLVNTKIKMRQHLSRVHHGQFALLENTSMDCLLFHQTEFVAIVEKAKQPTILMLSNAPVVSMVNGKTKMLLPNTVVKHVQKVVTL